MMPTMGRAKRRRRGRPAGGSAALVGAILSATLDRLGCDGYANLSIDEVAQVAGVNKTTIYRRWPTKSDLVIAAIVASRTNAPPFRPTGHFRRDLIALLRSKARLVATPRQRAICYAINDLDPAISDALVSELRRHRYTIPRDFVEHGIATGELPRGIDADVIAELLLAPIFHRSLVMCEPVPQSFIEQIVGIVLAGVRGSKRSSASGPVGRQPRDRATRPRPRAQRSSPSVTRKPR
jgi:AcrR family transcriptional regulator